MFSFRREVDSVARHWDQERGVFYGHTVIMVLVEVDSWLGELAHIQLLAVS